MYKAFLETVHNHADKVAINVVYNRPETPKALKRRREGKKRKAEDRTFFPSPKELTWGQLGKMVKECQEAITQAISGSRSQLRSSRGTVLFCACSGNFRLLVSWLAALGTGNTPVFVNPFSTQQQFEKVITETGPLVIFIETRVFISNKVELGSAAEQIPKVSLDEFQLEDTLSWTYFINRASVRKGLGDDPLPSGKMRICARSTKSVLREEEEEGVAIAKRVYTTWHDGSVRGIDFPSKGLCEYTRAIAEKVKITRCDRLISMHPVHYVAEQLVALQLPVVTGCSVTYYTPSRYTGVSDLVDFLHAVRPTAFGTIPRVWERLCFYAIYAWKKRSAGKRVLFQKRGNYGIEEEFLPADAKEGKRRKRKRRERKENPRKLLGLKDVHFAYSYRSQQIQVERFFATRGLRIACVDGFPEAGGVCKLRTGKEDEFLLPPEAKQPRWRETKMLLTRRGDYVPKKHVESLFFGSAEPIIKRVELVSGPWQSIGAVIYVDGEAASRLLTVPRNRLWRSRDLSEYLRDVVHRVNQKLPYDQRISCFTQRIVPEGGVDDVPLGNVVIQMYKDDKLV